METLIIDGRMGEGGGQILRSTLTLALLYGKSVEIRHIRAGRAKPGLMRQHLTCVKAAQQISGAVVSGAELGSSRLFFAPGPVQAGHYRFDVGSAGSTTLVFQTILLPLLQCLESSTVEFIGGTHNPHAPPLTFIKRSFLPLLDKMGGRIELKTGRWGFMPVGGGQWQVTLRPSRLQPLSCLQRGKLTGSVLTAYEVGLPNRVAERELQSYRKTSSVMIDDCRIRKPLAGSPGNLLVHDLEFENTRLCFTQLGRPRLRAEKVAAELQASVHQYLASDHVLDEFLTDQIMLPMLVAGGGRFSCGPLSLHAETNREVIRLISSQEFSFADGQLSL